MAEKKSIEIECPGCKTRFRLWAPVSLLAQWKDGKEIGCVTCRTRIKLEQDSGKFHVALEQPLEEIITEVVPEKAAKTRGAHTRPAAGAGEVILILDNDALVRKMAEDVLIKNNFKPLSVKNGLEAFNVIATKKIDIVVVDLHLKDPKDSQSIMDGTEFLQKLADSGRKIPAIVTTGQDLIDNIILQYNWYDIHVRAFIQKGSPFWTDDLLTKIKEILKKD